MVQNGILLNLSKPVLSRFIHVFYLPVPLSQTSAPTSSISNVEDKLKNEEIFVCFLTSLSDIGLYFMGLNTSLLVHYYLHYVLLLFVLSICLLRIVFPSLPISTLSFDICPSASLFYVKSVFEFHRHIFVLLDSSQH